MSCSAGHLENVNSKCINVFAAKLQSIKHPWATLIFNSAVEGLPDSVKQRDHSPSGKGTRNPQWDATSLQLKWLLNKNEKRTNGGETALLLGMQTVITTMENVLGPSDGYCVFSEHRVLTVMWMQLTWCISVAFVLS